MSSQSTVELEMYRELSKLLRIGNRAVRRAQEESRRLNVPNVYCHNDKIYYELPNGELTTVNPFQKSPS
jgi:hypothetical protein